MPCFGPCPGRVLPFSEGENRLPKGRFDLLTKVFPVILHRKKAVTAFFHDPGRDCFRRKTASPATTIASGSIVSGKRSASGISRPLPREAAWGCMAHRLFRCCTKGRKTMPGPAPGVLASAQCPAVNRDPGQVRFDIPGIRCPDGQPAEGGRHSLRVRHSRSFSRRRVARRFTAILSRRRPGRSGCLRDKPRPGWTAAFIALRPPGIDSRIRPDIASGRCNRPFLPGGSGISRKTGRADLMTGASISAIQDID